MKKIILILTLFFALSCNNNPVKKPKNFLNEETMENALLDYQVMVAGSINAPNEMQELNLTPLQFISKKYKIDSATFVQNHKYYAGDVNNYKHMNKRIFDRLSKIK